MVVPALAAMINDCQGDVGFGLHEREGGEVADLAGPDGAVGEVVVVEGLVVRQLGQAQPGAVAAFVADCDFRLQDQVEDVEVAHGSGVGAAASSCSAEFVQRRVLAIGEGASAWLVEAASAGPAESVRRRPRPRFLARM